MKEAIFGAGCFWGVEYKFSKLPGVISATSGYSGGHTRNPTYEDVCNDSTGHVEVVQVEYDQAEISYTELVEFFFSIHNPTTLNSQGPDFGTQYRSAIYYFDDEQKKQAEAIKSELNKTTFKNKIVTEISPAKEFWPAEEYHQKFYEKKGKTSC